MKKLESLDLDKVANNPDGVNIDDAQPPETDGRSQATHGLRHKFFNPELEEKTRKIQEEFAELYEELIEQRE